MLEPRAFDTSLKPAVAFNKKGVTPGTRARPLTRTEGVDVLVELEAHDCAIVVDDVGLTVPGAGHHLLPAVSLEREKNDAFIRFIFDVNKTKLALDLSTN